MSISIVVADDQALVRTGFRLILDAEPDLDVVAEASDGAEAVAAVEAHRPDVVLMDIRMPVMNGLEAAARILGPGAVGKTPRVVILTTYDLDEYVYQALQAGASGFVLKDTPAEQLIVGIRAVVDGESLFAPSVTRRLIETFVNSHPRTPPRACEIDVLTPRERETLQLIGRGLSNAEIAAELVVSHATVKTHVASLLAKLGLRDRVQAVVLAYETGLVRAGA